ncbi:type I polyketide synthase, partial [Streptomyces boncukensis]
DTPDADGNRPLAIHSQPHGTSTWTRHATGRLAPAPRTSTAEAKLTTWPPPQGELLDTGALYQYFHDNGFGYGPAFQGLTRAWFHQGSVYAEIQLPAEQQPSAADYHLHPALLDAALHGIALAPALQDEDGQLPFAWTGVSLHATGAGTVRVHLEPHGNDSLAVTVADALGQPVLGVESLVLRKRPKQLGTTGQGGNELYRLEWVDPAETGTATAPAAAPPAGGFPEVGAASELAALAERDELPGAVLVRCAPVEGETGAAVREATRRALELVQSWLAEDRFADARLVFVTRGAVASEPGDDVTDLPHAAVWGLVRAAQSENPDRFVLADLDGGEDAPAALAASLASPASDEPQFVIREGRTRVARLVAVTPADEPAAEPADEPADDGPLGAGQRALPDWDTSGTVLVTGATGTIGSVIARHLAAEGAPRLLLTSRRGMDAEGAAELREELTALGADATIARADAADPEAMAELLATVDDSHPLTAVIHTAGTLDDATIPSLTPEHLERVLPAKVDAALTLHRLTRDSGASLTLFSSIAGSFGGMGQGNYSAANAFLDAFAQSCRSRGFPVQSMAWGLWAEQSEMTGKLGSADLSRMARSGVLPFSSAEGAALFEAARAVDSAVVLPVRLDVAALGARSGPVPGLLRGLVRPQARGSGLRSASGSGAAPASGVQEQLASLPASEHGRVLLDLVLTAVADVLGYSSATEVEKDRGLLDFGFDSLTAVELRNRLSKSTGLRLPVTLLFDYPTSQAIADFLTEKLAAEAGDAPLSFPELDRLEQSLPGIAGDEESRARLAARLEELLTRLGPSEGEEDQVADRIGDASDDEIFDFIENELGLN